MHQQFRHKVVAIDRFYLPNFYRIRILVRIFHRKRFRFPSVCILFKAAPRSWWRTDEVCVLAGPCFRRILQGRLTRRPLQMDFAGRITWLSTRTFPCDIHDDSRANKIAWDLPVPSNNHYSSLDHILHLLQRAETAEQAKKIEINVREVGHGLILTLGQQKAQSSKRFHQVYSLQHSPAYSIY